MLLLRNEQDGDRAAVEELTRKAFYNIYVPGCVEQFLVHIMRDHEDFIPPLDFVAEQDGIIVGNIMYTKAFLTDEQGTVKNILTFGPISVLPEYQRHGIGKALMERSFQQAKELGFDVVVIMGSPPNYVSSGFKSCKKYNICLDGGLFPSALLVKELTPGALDGRRWVYRYSPVMDVDPQAAEEYDDGLCPMEKRYLPSQDEFYIMSQSFLGE